MGTSMIISGLNFLTVSASRQLKCSLLSHDGAKIPFANSIPVRKSSIPFPYIIDFENALNENIKVYAQIDKKNKRECTPLEIQYGRYQLDFISSDFSKEGNKDLEIWVEGLGIKEYIQEKITFIVSN